MLLRQPDARIMLGVAACLAARATGLTGNAPGRAWNAAAARNASLAGIRMKVISSAGVSLTVDGEADWPPEEQAVNQDDIYAESTDNSSGAMFASLLEVQTGWQTQPIGGGGGGLWAERSEQADEDDASDAAMVFGARYTAEAKAITEHVNGTDGSIVGVDVRDSATDKVATRTQWTLFLTIFGLAGIMLGLFLPTETGWDGRTPSADSLDVQGDVSSPVPNEREIVAAPPVNWSSTTSTAASCTSLSTSAGEDLLTAAQRQKASPIPVGEMSPALYQLGNMLVQQKWKVIFFWAVLCLCHLPLAAQIRSIISVNFAPTPQMPSYEALERLRKYFPLVANSAEFCLVLESVVPVGHEPPAPHAEVHNSSNKDSESAAAGAPLCVPGPHGRCNAGDCCKPAETCWACPVGFTDRNVSGHHCGSGAGFRQCKAMGYAQILDMPGLRPFSMTLRRELNTSGNLVEFTSSSTVKLDWGIDISSMLVAPAGNIAMMQFRIVEAPNAKESQEFARRAHHVVDRLLKVYLPNITFAGLLGIPEFINGAVESVEQSLLIMDLITLPVATFLLWWVLRSCRILVVLLCALAVSASCSFGVLYLVGVTCMHVDTLTPQVVMSILIAFNIDYALFLTTRFRSEVLDLTGSATIQTVVNEAAVSMLGSAGFTVITSGTILWLTFTALIFFPLGGVRSVGVGSTICLFFTVAVHVTLTPAFFSAFPKFVTSDFLKPSGASHNETPPFFDWVWKCMARRITARPNNVILVVSVLLLSSGTGLAATRMKVQATFDGMAPRGSTSSTALQLVSESFGLAGAEAVQVLLEPAPNMKGGVVSAEFWNASQRILYDIQVKLPGGPNATRFLSVSYMDGKFVPWRVADVCLRSVTYAGRGQSVRAKAGRRLRREVKRKTGICHKLQFLRKRYISAEGTATYAHMLPNFDPLGSQGQMWLKEARRLAGVWQKATGVRVTVGGFVVELEDVKDGVAAMVPVELGIVMISVLVLGLAFRSILIPLRSILTLTATMSVVYGLAVLAFQDGMMDFLGIPGIQARHGALNWLAPAVCFPISAGICLDYDVFLITRIGEYRAAACLPDRAIRHGLCNTGSIITAAGLIMTTAFSGHIATDLESANAFGFFLVVTVLLNTFIMQPVFTPACMSLMGRLNWWPGALFFILEQPQSREDGQK